MSNYKGERCMGMHISFDEYHNATNNEFRNYMNFTIIRNPLDSVVSAFFKRKHDHNGRFSRGTFKNGKPINKRVLEEFKFIQETDASFSQYFLKFYNEEYSIPRHETTAAKVDFVIRYENLNKDFEALCKLKGLNFTPIPIYNPSEGKNKSWHSYYDANSRERARQIFPRILSNWGYEFPKSWD